MNSCIVLVRKDDWTEACTAARVIDANDGAAVRAFFETLVRAEPDPRAQTASDTGLITGYYEPLAARRAQTRRRIPDPVYTACRTIC